MKSPDTRRDEGGDFPDWLNPMIVKEMRQSLRTHVFVCTFVLLVCVLVGTASLALLNADFGGGAVFASFSALLWGAAGVALLLVVPAQGINSLGREVSAQTVDLLLLSRLSAWNVVVGKWGALQSQALLLASLLLPFAMLRFLIGGVPLVWELYGLAMFVVVSAVWSAITVGTSAFPIVTRIAVLGATAFGSLFMIPSLVMAVAYRSSFGGMSSATPEEIALWVGGGSIILAVLAIAFLLQMGAGWIAPPAENHALGKRLCGVLALGIGLAISSNVSGGEWALSVWILTGWSFGVVALDALTEKPVVFPEMCRPFVRRKLGPFALLFTPGWPSGTLFFGIGLMLWAICFPPSHLDASDRIPLICFALFFGCVPTLFNEFNHFSHRHWLLSHLIQAGVLSIATGFSAVIVGEDIFALFGALGLLAAGFLFMRGLPHFQAISRANQIAREQLHQESGPRSPVMESP